MGYLNRPPVDVRTVRKECKKPVANAVIALMGEGWTVVRSGHKFRLVCPCRPAPATFRVDGTPRNPDVLARQIERKAARCPEQHDLIR